MPCRRSAGPGDVRAAGAFAPSLPRSLAPTPGLVPSSSPSVSLGVAFCCCIPGPVPHAQGPAKLRARILPHGSRRPRHQDVRLLLNVMVRLSVWRQAVGVAAPARPVHPVARRPAQPFPPPPGSARPQPLPQPLPRSIAPLLHPRRPWRALPALVLIHFACGVRPIRRL